MTQTSDIDAATFDGVAVGHALARVDALKAEIQDERAALTVAKQQAAADRDAYRDSYASLRAEIDAARARMETYLQTNPRLLHLTGFRQAFNLYARCAALGEKLRADAYIAHDDIPLLAAEMLAERFGGQVVYDAAEFPDRRERFGQFQLAWPPAALDLMARYLDPLVRSCAFTLTGGEPIAEHIREAYGVPSHTVYNARRVVHDGVDPEIRERCGVGPDDVLALYVNTVSRGSLFENLIDGLALLDERHHLAVLGNVAPSAKGLDEELEARAEAAGVRHRLHFLGVVEYDDMPRFASGADCAVIAVDPRIKNCRMFVHNRYFDAMSAGLPMISSLNVGAQRVFDSVPFYSEFDLFDPGDFAAKVRACDVSSAARERVRDHARDTTWQRSEAPKVVELFQGMRSVTILTVKDVALHQRTRYFAQALGEAGVQVTIACRKRAETAPELPNTTWYRVDNVQ